MKKLIYPVAVVLLLSIYNCKKSTDGNTGVISTTNTETNNDVKTQTDRYVAEDGTSTLVSFNNENGKKSISISSNKMTIKAPETEDGVYADYNYKIVSKNDSITITQGNNVIKLKKARGN